MKPTMSVRESEFSERASMSSTSATGRGRMSTTRGHSPPGEVRLDGRLVGVVRGRIPGGSLRHWKAGASHPGGSGAAGLLVLAVTTAVSTGMPT